MAAHLGLRLVADEAYEHGWGTPVEWLRSAEAYFERTGAVSVVSACRAGLRRLGAPVPQRRAGIDLVPFSLRAMGVTVREYEVFQLLGERLGNKAIASRLQISPRTVEKHVASLLAKTALPHRDALTQHARDLLAS
jgi:DNA-binding CsgD family transcriptional regulator